MALRLIKLCYKVSLCKNCQRQSSKALIGLSIRAEMIGGDVYLNANFAISVSLLGAAAALSGNLTNTVLASQLLQWNIKLLTMFIN